MKTPTEFERRCAEIEEAERKTRIPILVGLFAALVFLGAWGYVAVHFVRKYW